MSADTSLESHLGFVNDQIAYHEKRATSPRTNNYAQKLHLETAARFRLLADAIVIASSNQAPAVTSALRPKQLRLSLTPEDIKGLPQELLGELSISGDLTEFAILEVIEESGGISSLDRIIVGLYRKTGEINKRQAVISRLYRMGQKGLVYNVPGKKGVYSLELLTEVEAAALLGDSPPQTDE